MAKKSAVILMSILVVLIPVSSLAQSSGDRFFISYRDAEGLALENSHKMQAQGHVVTAAENAALAQKVKRFPQFSFGAESTVVSKVGSINVAALGITQQVGERLNWSVGPSINAVIWDTGQIINKARSLQKIASVEKNQLDFDQRQVLLNARAAYIGAQLAKEQVKLITEALRLARAQYAYVSDKARVGTADTFDLTVAHQEMTDREKDFDEANGELAIFKRDLLGAIGLDEEMARADSVDVEPVLLVLNTMLPHSEAPVDIESHPQVKGLADREASAKLAAKSTIVKYYPEIKLKGSATFEYPNLGQADTIQQNRASLNLSVPMLDWGMIAKTARSERHQAKAAHEEKKQTIVDLTRDVSDVRSRIETFKKLRISTARAAKDASEVARLSFESYKIGKIIFLDVQRANVKALSAKLDEVRTDANLGLEIAKLMALSDTEGDFQ